VASRADFGYSRRMHRSLAVLSAVLGFLGVALGAFGAHGVKTMLASAPDAAQRLAWWDTAAKYHLIHAVAVGLAAVLAARAGGAAVAAGWLFAAGLLLFAGSLYVMTITNVRVLGAVTPIGGLLLLAGWIALGIAASRLPAGS
jgi:uncharacterized membrane protein YgdD (TMEM256/DUF423 family)